MRTDIDRFMTEHFVQVPVTFFEVDFNNIELNKNRMKDNKNYMVFQQMGVLGSFKLLDEIKNWMEESGFLNYSFHLKPQYSRTSFDKNNMSAIYDMDAYISFSSEIELMAFKMKWL